MDVEITSDATAVSVLPRKTKLLLVASVITTLLAGCGSSQPPVAVDSKHTVGEVCAVGESIAREQVLIPQVKSDISDVTQDPNVLIARETTCRVLREETSERIMTLTFSRRQPWSPPAGYQTIDVTASGTDGKVQTVFQNSSGSRNRFFYVELNGWKGFMYLYDEGIDPTGTRGDDLAQAQSNELASRLFTMVKELGAWK
ncbi:hypothetical protein [Nocardia camponoti]|uniref:Uncharacterized protein n=1 Tax=Nocardia camponoti TaxID=1616106 RepID=A0A917QAU1_9NOCA|nr:hypothetical protein [Nocardia camponoti]GGK40625.1 hypothetical protein GCM10011591_10260 [Nocardia camponoti]